MKLMRHGTLAAIALTSILALAACGSDNPSADSSSGGASSSADCATGTLTAQGSTAQKNAMDEWVKAYQEKCSGATINYQATGSSAGRQAFISGTADFGGSDSALKDGDEQTNADKRCKSGPAVHLPTVVGPIAVVYNLDGVSSLQLKPSTIAKIFSGAVTKWDDAVIKADNPEASLPSTPILAVHRSDGSGTTDNFTAFLAQTAASDWTFGHDSNWKAPGGSGQKGSDGVGAQLTKSPGAIGYVEWSFAQVNKLKMAKVGNGAGEAVELTAASAGKTINGASVTGTGDDLKLKIDYATKEAGAYPIVLVSYEIVCSKGNDPAKLALLKSFLKFAVSAQQQAALANVGYGPLPDSVRTKVETAIGNLA